jgi:2-polyprenyl-3-methyl-5-hydroxy-6-metoxy-1,4-benzoquinol methylase
MLDTMNERNASEMREIGDIRVDSGREPSQLQFYHYAQRYVAGMSVLDVGCGMGEGLQVLSSVAASVTGLDLDPRLAGPNVIIGGIESVPSKSYDVVTAVEVIEHVEAPEAFIAHCCRIARSGVFLTTPNWTFDRCSWPFHLREYTPREFAELLSGAGGVTLLKANWNGSMVFEVRHPKLYFALNDLRTWGATAFLARVINRMLSPRAKLHSKNAAWITVSP